MRYHVLPVEQCQMERELQERVLEADRNAAEAATACKHAQERLAAESSNSVGALEAWAEAAR